MYENGGDFSGCVVLADKKIYVQTGAKWGSVGNSMFPIADTYDHMTDTLPDINTLGSKYYVASFNHRTTGDIIKIIGNYVML